MAVDSTLSKTWIYQVKYLAILQMSHSVAAGGCFWRWGYLARQRQRMRCTKFNAGGSLRGDVAPSEVEDFQIFKPKWGDLVHTFSY